jgi:hypothetical protein
LLLDPAASGLAPAARPVQQHLARGSLVTKP